MTYRSWKRLAELCLIWLTASPACCDLHTIASHIRTIARVREITHLLPKKIPHRAVKTKWVEKSTSTISGT
jgi:hypothetical protein